MPDPTLTPEAVELPPLPVLNKPLLDTIGEYGMARTDRASPLEVQRRWELLIVGIKDYTKDFARAAVTKQAAERDEARQQAIEFRAAKEAVEFAAVSMRDELKVARKNERQSDREWHEMRHECDQLRAELEARRHDEQRVRIALTDIAGRHEERESAHQACCTLVGLRALPAAASVVNHSLTTAAPLLVPLSPEQIEEAWAEASDPDQPEMAVHHFAELLQRMLGVRSVVPLTEERVERLAAEHCHKGMSDPFVWSGSTHLCAQFARGMFIDGLRAGEQSHGILPEGGVA